MLATMAHSLSTMKGPLAAGLLLLGIAVAAAVSADFSPTARAQDDTNATVDETLPPANIDRSGEVRRRDTVAEPRTTLDWLWLHGLPLAAIALGMIAAHWLGRRLVHRSAMWMTRSSDAYDDEARAARAQVLAGYFYPVVTIIVVIVGGLMLLTELQIPTQPLIAMASTVFALFGVAFVATWSVISHTFCSVMLLITQPFSVGDTVEVVGPNVRGKVVNFNMLYTTLQTAEGEYVNVPNALFFQNPVRRKLGTGGGTLDQHFLHPKDEPVDPPG
jgi:hypothetical protein